MNTGNIYDLVLSAMAEEKELQAFFSNKIMIAKTILKMNAPELSKFTKIPIKRIIFLQRMGGHILNF